MARRFGLVVMLGSLAACGCGSDGHTPDCPELPLYTAREPISDEARAQLIAAADAHCITLPTGFDTGEGGSGGSD